MKYPAYYVYCFYFLEIGRLTIEDRRHKLGVRQTRTVQMPCDNKVLFSGIFFVLFILSRSELYHEVVVASWLMVNFGYTGWTNKNGTAYFPQKQTTEPKLLILVSCFSGEVSSYTGTSYCIHILWAVCRSIFIGPPCIQMHTYFFFSPTYLKTLAMANAASARRVGSHMFHSALGRSLSPKRALSTIFIWKKMSLDLHFL